MSQPGPYATRAIMAMTELQKIMMEGMPPGKNVTALPAVVGAMGVALGIRIALANREQAERMVNELESIGGRSAEALEVMLRSVSDILMEPLDTEDEK